MAFCLYKGHMKLGVCAIRLKRKLQMKVLVLAGGFDQIQLIQEYKKRGSETILVDYYEQPPAKEFAKEHYQISTLDIDAVKEIARNEKVDLISTACTDQALLTMAKVSEELGLPCYLSYQNALEVTNKILMKTKMLENHIPTANFCIVEDISQIDLSGIHMPLVVKPADANSSRGITKVTAAEELEAAAIFARENSRQGKIIVEEYKEGEEISIDAWVTDGIVQILCVSSSVKLKENDSNFTIIQSRYPCILAIEEEQIIQQILQDIVSCFGLENSPLLVQMIKGKQEINVIEFSARMGGGTKYKLIEKASGIDTIRAFVDLTFHMSTEINVIRSTNLMHMNYNYCYPGEIKSYEGFELMKEQRIIDEYFLYKTAGMIIQKANNSGDRSSGYLVSAKTIDELSEKEQRAEKEIKVIDINGIDIKRRLLKW